MSTMNKVILIGYLKSTPRFATTRGGEQMVSFEVETKEWWKDKATGQMKSKSDKHLVSSFSTMIVENAKKMKQGDFIMLEGKLQAKEWINEKGISIITTLIIIPNFTGMLKKITEGAFANMDHKQPMSFRKMSEEEAKEENYKEEVGFQDNIPF